MSRQNIHSFVCSQGTKDVIMNCNTHYNTGDHEDMKLKNMNTLHKTDDYKNKNCNTLNNIDDYIRT